MSLSIERALHKAKRHIKKGEIELAENAYKSVLAVVPENTRAIEGLKALQNPKIRMSAGSGEPSQEQINGLVALYNQGKLQESLVLGETLIKQFPNTPVLANVLGAVNAGLGRLEEAAKCFRKGVELKPDYVDAHSNLGNALTHLGKPEEAIGSYRTALELKPNFAEAHNNLGNALKTLGRIDEAVAGYRKALRIKPDFADARYNLANALRDLGRPEEAIACYQKALQLKPDHADAHFNLGNALTDLGKLEAAVACYYDALKITPDTAVVHNNLGNVLKHLGKPEQAIASYQNALKHRPDYADAHMNLSTVKKYQDGDPQIQPMLQLVERTDLVDGDRMLLNFALSKVYDDLDDYDKAFSYLLDGNRLRKEELKFDTSMAKGEFANIKAIFAGDSADRDFHRDRNSEKGLRPIFVLGMPRSGTSLVEQILASHSRVHGAGELALLGHSVNAIEWESMALSSDKIASIRGSYLAGLEKIGTSEKYIIDKMPANFCWIGFICTAISEAKIIHVKRDARATCWSNYKQFFPSKSIGFAYDFQHVAEYYKMYVDLMDFWHEKYPGRIYDLDYEVLTENQGRETRKLLEHVGLEWENQCINFHEVDRVVQTASAIQVRQRLYRGSSEQWRRYEKHLEPMLELLQGL